MLQYSVKTIFEGFSGTVGHCARYGTQAACSNHSKVLDSRSFPWLRRSSSELRNAFLPVATQQYTYYLFNVLCLLSIFNIVVSCYPLVRKKDNLTDIALTPSQRALLGLDPDETPPVTPSTRYITPPRYSRSITPRKNSSGNWSGSNNPSPTSRNASPSLGLERIGLPFSPLTSLNWQKAIGGSRNVANRDSYGSPSPIGIGRSLKDTSVLGVPSTPSPSGGKGSSVGLNSRWLYERGRASPGSRMPKIYS